MNRRNLFIILILSSLFLLSACQRGGDISTGAPRSPFLGGSTGLFIDFERGSPPDEVTDGGTFDFNAVVILRNDGEFDIRRDQVKVDIIGILPGDFNAIQQDLIARNPIDDLNGRKRDAEGNLIEGVTTFVTFPNDVEPFTFSTALKGNQEFTFRAQVCYFYTTEAVTELCVLRDLINVREDVICDPSRHRSIHSSGAPVHVSNFRQSVLGKDKVGFSFDIVHRGTGTIFKAKDFAADPFCPRDSRERRSSESRVLVTVETALPGLRCTGLQGGSIGHVILVNGKRSVTCVQDLDPNRNDFEKPINVILEYNYLDNKETEVLVKHLINS